jgi:hypothetical protein
LDFVSIFSVCLKDLEIVDNRVVRWINVGCTKDNGIRMGTSHQVLSVSATELE